MGLLSHGTPLSWPETKQNADRVRTKGINEFLNIYNRFKRNKNEPFKWGDEIEFSLVKFDPVNKRVYLLLKAETVLSELDKQKETNSEKNVSFHPEYASYMVEATPARPFDYDLNCFTKLQENMKLRRKMVEDLLDKDEHIICLTSFPLIGCPCFTWPSYKPTPNEGITRSLFYPDQAIFSGHPRFSTLSNNIRERRHDNKVAIHLPIYHDSRTQTPFREQLDSSHAKLAKDDHVYMDGEYENVFFFGQGWVNIIENLNKLIQ